MENKIIELRKNGSQILSVRLSDYRIFLLTVTLTGKLGCDTQAGGSSDAKFRSELTAEGVIVGSKETDTLYRSAPLIVDDRWELLASTVPSAVATTSKETECSTPHDRGSASQSFSQHAKNSVGLRVNLGTGADLIAGDSSFSGLVFSFIYKADNHASDYPFSAHLGGSGRVVGGDRQVNWYRGILNPFGAISVTLVSDATISPPI